jgi:hypothetical protein
MFPPFIECYSKNIQDKFWIVINRLRVLLSIERKVYFNGGNPYGSGNYPEYLRRKGMVQSFQRSTSIRPSFAAYRTNSMVL